MTGSDCARSSPCPPVSETDPDERSPWRVGGLGGLMPLLEAGGRDSSLIGALGSAGGSSSTSPSFPVGAVLAGWASGAARPGWNSGVGGASVAVVSGSRSSSLVGSTGSSTCVDGDERADATFSGSVSGSPARLELRVLRDIVGVGKNL